ncbi:MAG: class I SAM-dependent methyltransferase [Acidobacteria bacterium]|nr:class I SAM-dependent methyltransferase [Acidobacteriota bacterium]MBI3658788.1 class I SAM-dependent methyltransferase [Acidobacteriota bacterium]
MKCQIRLWEFFIELHSLYLMRYYLTASSEAVAEHRAEIIALAEDMRVFVPEEAIERARAKWAGMPKFTRGLDVDYLDVVEGYRLWADCYDDMRNPLILVEEPIVQEILGSYRNLRVLDAACGTGRHTAWLARHGHRVTALDRSPAMLGKAKEKLQAERLAADFQLGDIMHLPYGPNRFDMVLCALAINHVADVRGALTEFARVLSPGGLLVISDLHPMWAVLGVGAFFFHSQGAGQVQTHARQLSDWIDSLRSVPLELLDLREPVIDEAVANAYPFPDMYEALRGLPIGLVFQLRKPG